MSLLRKTIAGFQWIVESPSRYVRSDNHLLVAYYTGKVWRLMGCKTTYRSFQELAERLRLVEDYTNERFGDDTGGG